MNNPLRILRAVDARLDQPIEFFLFGRAALVLGSAGAAPEAADTKDVDGIIPRDPIGGLRAAAFTSAVDPDIPEIWELFEAAKPMVLSMAQRQG